MDIFDQELTPVTLRMSRRIHAALLKKAEIEGRSMNAQAIRAILDNVGEITTTVDVEKQESKVTRGKRPGAGRPRKTEEGKD